MSSSKERSQTSPTSRHFAASVSFTSMEKEILESLKQEVVKASFLDTLNKAKHIKYPTREPRWLKKSFM